MRITCPSCQATYVVNESDIPEEGIEVECSACMTRWMQMPAGQALQANSPEAGAPEAGQDKPARPAPDIQPPEAEAPPASEPEAEQEPEPASEPVGSAGNISETEAAETEADVVATPMPQVDAPVPDGVTAPEAVSFMDAPSDLSAPEPDEKETTWRVPSPPAKDLSARDPLDDVLAEMDSGFLQTPADDALADEDAAPNADSATTHENTEAKAPAEPAQDQPTEQNPEVPDSYFDEIAEIDPPSDTGPDAEPWAGADGSGPSDAIETDEKQSDRPQTIEEIETMAAQVEKVMNSRSMGNFPEPEAEPESRPEPQPEPEPEAEAVSEPEDITPAPVSAPRHWSEQISATPAKAEGQPDGIPAEDARKDMENLIRNLSDTVPLARNIVEFPTAETDETSSTDTEEDGELRPWEGAAAPVVEAALPDAANEPAMPAKEDDDDDFEWEELEEPENGGIGFDPEPEPDSLEANHIAAIEKQNGLDLRPVAPEVTNIIEAEVHGSPFATMGSSAPEKKPSQPSAAPSAPATSPAKPTPVDSADDIEAAIRAQLSSLQTSKSEPENTDGKFGLLGKFGKSRKAAPETAAAVTIEPKAKDPLKSALLDFDDEPRPRSGKRLGFFLVIYLFLILLAVYLFAENIAAMVPALEPVLTVFSNMIDGLRGLTQKMISGG